MYDDPKYTYRLLMRPPGPGAVPRDGLLWTDDNDEWTGNRHTWGHAVYSRKLTDEEIEHYEMERVEIS